MKSWGVIFAVALVLVAPLAFAQNETNVTENQTSATTPTPGPFTLGAQQLSQLSASAGVTPDSVLYFLDSSLDRLNLWIASWGGPQALAEASLKVMNETRAETILMALQNNTAAMATAQSRFESVKNGTLNTVQQLRNDSTRAIILSQMAAITQEKVEWLGAALANVSVAARPAVQNAASIANATLQDAKARLLSLTITLPERISFCAPQFLTKILISASGGRCQVESESCPAGLTQVTCSAQPPRTEPLTLQTTNTTNSTG